MNKAELIEHMANNADLNKAQAGRALDALVDAVRRTLKKPVPDMDDARRLALREEIKRVELSAERGLLDELASISGPPSGAAFDVVTALAAASRAWSDRVPREALKTLAGRLPQPGPGDV